MKELAQKCLDAVTTHGPATSLDIARVVSEQRYVVHGELVRLEKRGVITRTKTQWRLRLPD